MPSTSKKSNDWIRPAGTCFLAFLVYGLSLKNSFIWDDEEQIVGNVFIQSIHNLFQVFSHSSFNSGGATKLAGIYYKPIMLFFYNLLWSAFGNTPAAFHLFQLCIHLGSTLLLGAFLEDFFPALGAWALSLIFLIHPLNVECVVYVADLQDTLFFFFGILSLFVMSKSRQSFSIQKQILYITFLILSLLSKESGILFLCITAVYAFLFRTRTELKSIIILNTVALITYLWFRFGLANLEIRSGEIFESLHTTFYERFLTFPKVLYFYFSHFIFPKDLAIDQRWVVRETSFQDFTFPLFFDLCFLILLFLPLLLRREKRNIFFAVWVMIGLALHSQFFPLDLTVADRWFYFPMVGTLGLLGVGITQIQEKCSTLYRSKAFSITFAVILILLSIRSFIRVQDWENGLTLFSHDVALNSESFDLQNNVGTELFRAGRFPEAKAHFEISVRLAPDWWTNWNNLGASYEHDGDLTTAELAYQKSIQRHYYLAYENLAKLLYRQNKIEELKNFLEKTGLVDLPQNVILNQIYKIILQKS